MESSEESRGFIPVIPVGIIKKGANSTIRLMRSLPLLYNFFTLLIYFDNVLHDIFKTAKTTRVKSTSKVLLACLAYYMSIRIIELIEINSSFVLVT